MPGQPSVAFLMLWNTHWLDNPMWGVCPPRRRTLLLLLSLSAHSANFQLSSSTGGLFLFHKNNLDMALCKQSLIQDLTISVSKMQLCSLFPVSFSNCGQPLQPQEVAAPQPVLCKPQEDLSLILQNWVFSSPKIRAVWSNTCHQPDRLNPSYWPTSCGCPFIFQVC